MSTMTTESTLFQSVDEAVSLDGNTITLAGIGELDLHEVKSIEAGASNGLARHKAVTITVKVGTGTLDVHVEQNFRNASAAGKFVRAVQERLDELHSVAGTVKMPSGVTPAVKRPNGDVYVVKPSGKLRLAGNVDSGIGVGRSFEPLP